MLKTIWVLKANQYKKNKKKISIVDVKITICIKCRDFCRRMVWHWILCIYYMKNINFKAFEYLSGLVDGKLFYDTLHL